MSAERHTKLPRHDRPWGSHPSRTAMRLGWVFLDVPVRHPVQDPGLNIERGVWRMSAETIQSVVAPDFRLKPDWEPAGWRFEQLMKSGWDPNRAEVISKRLDIDLHEACDLVKVGGVSPDLAARILL